MQPVYVTTAIVGIYIYIRCTAQNGLNLATPDLFIPLSRFEFTDELSVSLQIGQRTICLAVKTD